MCEVDTSHQVMLPSHSMCIRTQKIMEAPKILATHRRVGFCKWLGSQGKRHRASESLMILFGLELSFCDYLEAG